MKRALLVLIPCLLSCSCGDNDKNATEQLATDSLVASDQTESQSIEPGKKYQFNYSRIAELSRKLAASGFEMKLSEGDVTERNFRKIDTGFYEGYIKGNEIFREWNISQEEDYWGAYHYHWGATQRENMHLILVYEHFTLDDAEDKLFMLAIDRDGKLINVVQVAELTHYPESVRRTSALIEENELTVFSVFDRVAGDITPDSVKYVKDSITSRYSLANWRNIIRIQSDSNKVEYWK